MNKFITISSAILLGTAVASQMSMEDDMKRLDMELTKIENDISLIKGQL